ncbi:formimidoylglutamate deiminase [Nocardioides sp. Bht2]|uniref:formimidoylglutamate deiminase n=1 Tax=Nocardioides sp. Bht2 TaxID=3392297 RepID=UPI0039B6ABEC
MRLLLQHAVVAGETLDGVLVEITDGRFTAVTAGAEDPNVETVPGLALPGFANAHSHAFHRALRGRTQRTGTFWSWRNEMYRLAERLDPDRLHELAVATYTEMLCAGITTVGEFHYLHHGPGGVRYDDPNAMGQALIEAAAVVGIRITLLDTCYLTAGIGRPAEGVQLRFSDGDAESWAQRLGRLRSTDTARIGAALHSVRAVPRDQMGTVVRAARGMPLHVHLSEQVAENDEALVAWGLTPTEVLASAGALGPQSTLVHGTHLTSDDVGMLGRADTFVCFCPTTERDLGDGIGPGRELAAAGVRMALGTDSHAVIDMFEEMRGLEMNERLATQRRGLWRPAELLAAATAHSQASLGFDDAGEIAVGARADLVIIDPASPRTAGSGKDLAGGVFAATGADVAAVMVDGRWHDIPAVRDGLGARLDGAIERAWA